MYFSSLCPVATALLSGHHDYHKVRVTLPGTLQCSLNRHPHITQLLCQYSQMAPKGLGALVLRRCSQHAHSPEDFVMRPRFLQLNCEPSFPHLRTYSECHLRNTCSTPAPRARFSSFLTPFQLILSSSSHGSPSMVAHVAWFG